MSKSIKSLFIALVILLLVISNNLPVQGKDRGPLTKIKFVHYKKEKEDARNRKTPRPSATPMPTSVPVPTATPTASTCFGFISDGAKWKTSENITLNSNNSFGLTQSFLTDKITKGVGQWESYGSNIFGNIVIDNSATANFSSIDNKNTIQFTNLGNDQIAVTNVWGFFGGDTSSREIVEWDMQVNTKYVFGDAAQNGSLMDFQEIVTHELGHAAGMKDLYDGSCNLETMYGYSYGGEVIKRDLYNGDIFGIKQLYK